jgi:hypothetical protein
MLKISHDHGFFSCCSVRIWNIIQYFNNKKILPNTIDCSGLFTMYKDTKNDISYDFFEKYDNINIIINYEKNILITDMNFQFNNYKNVDYSAILPFVKKYFSPSNNIINISNNLLSEYKIDTSNCIGLYYRGTDKYIETKLGGFKSYYDKLNEIINKEENKNVQILLQTDSAQFLDYMKEKKINNIIVIQQNKVSYTSRGIHKEQTRKTNHQDIKYLFATFLIISKCKYLICSSGNCSIWMMYYRENANNIYQFLNDKWME